MDDKLSKIWNMLQHSKPEQREKIINSLSKETIVALRTLANPYKKPVYLCGKEKILACCLLNVTEKYAQRFAITGLIAFIYRMLDEYQLENNYISESSVQFAMPYNEYLKNLKRLRPLELSKDNPAELLRYQIHFLKED